MPNDQRRNGMAYGVDPTRPQFFSLRQARYDALGHDLAEIADSFAERGERMKLLDIGVNDGVTIRHLESRRGHENVDYSAADLVISEDLFHSDRLVGTFVGDLMEGYPDIPSGSYDVVVCEQVLEHLTEIEVPIRTLERLLKPGGLLFVGVPIFPHGIHKLRELGQPIWDRYFPPNKVRGHVQSFSKRKILHLFNRLTDLQLREVRGFRIVSGGWFRELEEKEWWWRASRTLGRTVPGLCVEIQAIFTRP